MNIEEIFKKFKSKTLDIEFEKYLSLSSQKKANIEPDAINKIGNNLSNIRCFGIIDGIDESKEIDTFKMAYLEFLSALFSDNNNREVAGLSSKFSKDDLSIKRINKLSSSQKTELLLDLLEGYKRYLPIEKIASLKYSLRNPGLNGNPDLETELSEDEIQNIQARIEIYKNIFENRKDSEIAQKYDDLMLAINYDDGLFSYLLNHKDYDSSIKKRKKDNKKYEELRRKIQKDDIDEVLEFFRKIKRKFKIPYENIKYDIELQEDIWVEEKNLEELSEIYRKVLEKEKAKEIAEKLNKIKEEYVEKVRRY